MDISIIIPAYNNPHYLDQCLHTLSMVLSPEVEIIVIDDASTEDILTIATQHRVQGLRLTHNAGPAAARNHGARHARGDILFFVDADVIVPPEAVRYVVQFFKAHPDIAAVFGSYDVHPRAPGLISQYRNLLHHFVHQHGNATASTFWAGCGAIRRLVFEAVGGFDAKNFLRPSIEDIELGYRLCQAGYRIVLDKTLQGTHLKRWTFRTMIWTDIYCRAIPWSRLIRESKQAPNDLNLARPQQLCAALAGVASACLLLAVYWMPLLILTALAVGSVLVINRDLYRFFWQHRGRRFAVACLMLHWLYYLYSGLSYCYVGCVVKSGSRYRSQYAGRLPMQGIGPHQVRYPAQAKNGSYTHE
jgi:glycosyltransferase involved in cell wall biosynthesis